MRRRLAVSSFVLACSSLWLAAGASAQAPANDHCANAQAIVGSGPFAFDLTQATTGFQGLVAPGCDPAGGIGIAKDVWFCWTANCTGLVEFSTCGQTGVDTKVRIYAGCGCPNDLASPICCDDDSCELQTRFVCEVVCGQTYLIQLGTKPNAAGGPGTFTMTCLGKPCDGGHGGTPPEECDCCGERPGIVENPGSPFVPFVPGVVAAVTNSPFGLNDPSVYVVELGNESSAPLGANWSAAQRYSHPSWTMAKLGQVFGVALDGAGTIYVAHSSCYGTIGQDFLGSLGGAGSIYRLDGATGVASELIRLPNSIDPIIAQTYPTEAYPGLGNLNHDCATGRLYAANLEDGRIYAIDPNGGNTKVRSTFDVATGAITGPLPNNALAEPGDAPGWVPLGDRPYAVKAAGGRLYYSVWGGSVVQNPPVGVFVGGVNTVRSIALDANGDFVPNTDQLEITLPAFPGFAGSSPVVDISFDDEDCCIYLAERGIDEIMTYAHAARVLRYCRDDSGSAWGAPFVYQLGLPNICSYANLNSATGGVAVDSSTGIVWAMGDYLGSAPCGPPFIYGLQGQPLAGAPTGSSVLVDLDGVTNVIQKYFLGSLDLSCPPACAKLETLDLRCVDEGVYSWTFTLTNQSGTSAGVLILPDPAFSPNVIPLIPPVPNGGTSAPITVTITGPGPGIPFCFDLILGDLKGNECCHLRPCIDLPDCECLEVRDVTVSPGSTPGTFQLSFEFQNLASWATGHIVFIAIPGPATFSPAIVSTAIAPFASQTIGPVTVTTTLPPGSTLCFTLGNHSANWLLCCFRQVCVTVPAAANHCDEPDLDGDGVVDAADLAILLGAWGSDGPGDLDCDGTVGAADLAILLGAWG